MFYVFVKIGIILDQKIFLEIFFSKNEIELKNISKLRFL